MWSWSGRYISLGVKLLVWEMRDLDKIKVDIEQICTSLGLQLPSGLTFQVSNDLNQIISTFLYIRHSVIPDREKANLLYNPWYPHPGTPWIKCKMKHVVLKPTNSIFVLLIIFFLSSPFPLDLICPPVSDLRKREEKRYRPQPGVWPQACNRSVIMLWVGMTKRIIYSDISDRVMRLLGFCFIFASFALILKPHGVFPSCV